jgi:thiamine-phosphate pyrophosphorylase
LKPVEPHGLGNLVEQLGQEPIDRAFLLAAILLARNEFGEATLTSEILLLHLLRRSPGLRGWLITHGLDMTALETALAAVRGPALQLDEPLLLDDPVAMRAADRILDAASNRAREALRVLEDFARFVLNDPLTSRELKQLRHDLTQALAQLPLPDLMAARDVPGDVGTAIATSSERLRHACDDVLDANAKRLQEALRSLEEFAKLHSPDAGEAFERLRYRAYTMEKVLQIGQSARRRLAYVRLCVLLTGKDRATSLDWLIAEAAAGGADLFQLREKNLSDRQLLLRAREVRRWTRQAGVLFVVNDRIDIALLAEADGVHLGQEDLGVREARCLLGARAIVGVSTHDMDQLRRAVLDGADYIGIGPTFPSATKEFSQLAGLEFVRAANAETTLPAFAIGGIGLDNVGKVTAAGAKRIAVGHAIVASPEPRATAAALRRALGD